MIYINLTALISCKIIFDGMRIPIVPIFVLSVKYTLDKCSNICSAIKCPLEITADDYFVASIGGVYTQWP